METEPVIMNVLNVNYRATQNDSQLTLEVGLKDALSD